MNEPKSMSKVFDWKQNELQKHLENWREFAIQQLEPWTNLNWITISETKKWIPLTNHEGYQHIPQLYFEIKISGGPYELSEDDFSSTTTIEFLSNGMVEHLKQIFIHDEVGFATNFYNQHRELCNKLENISFKDSLNLLKKLLKYYSTSE